MNISSYCKQKGMNIDQYKQFTQNINNAAAAIIQYVKSNYKTDTGVYYPIAEILTNIPGKTDSDIQGFIIHALKSQGMEFIDNNTLWRY